MSHVYSSIQAELLDLNVIFTKSIPNCNYTNSDEFIDIHMKPYLEWRNNFKKKKIKYSLGVINTEKQSEIIHLLIFVEYCCNYYIYHSNDVSFLLEIIQTYPTAMNYTFHPTTHTYYPVVNLLFNYCFQHPAKIWPTKFTHILYPIIQNNNCDMFIKIYYSLLDNDSDRNIFIRFLSDFTFSNCTLMEIKYDFFMKNIFRIPRVCNNVIEYMDNYYVTCLNNNSRSYTTYFIGKYKDLYFMFIWMEKQITEFIFKKKREEIYYIYYLLHLYLYKDCLVSFKTHLSYLEEFIHKHDIKIFKSSQCWEWIFEIIIDLQDGYPNIFRKTKYTTHKIEYLYNFFSKYCDDKYSVYAYYDSKLAWIIQYPKNVKLVRTIYNDLKQQTIMENYKYLFLDIIRYGNYELVMNSWYFIENRHIKYLKMNEFEYYTFSENDAFSLAIMNKDKRVLEFICEHYDREKVTIHTISKCFLNLFIFYEKCYEWKKRNLLRECKKKIEILLEHYYFKDIWLSFLLGYFFFLETYKTVNKDINHLRLWLLKKCIQIEKKQKNIKNVLIHQDFHGYIWVNYYKCKNCIVNSNYKKYLNEYAETFLSSVTSNNELNDYRGIIIYIFINDLYTFIQTQKNGDIEFTSNIKHNIITLFKKYQNDSAYMISIFTQIMKLFSDMIKNNREIDSTIFTQFKNVTSFLLQLCIRNDIKLNEIIFYVIYELNYLRNCEILDWCIRQGMCFYDTELWETEVKNYPCMVSTENLYYKWNLVAKVCKKAILRYRLKKNIFSKQLVHIEMMNKYVTKSLYQKTNFMHNDVIKEDIYHPRHVTKKEAINILDDVTWVSPKLDGTRTVLYLSDLENKHPKLLSSTKEIFQHYYFIAEKIFYKSRIIYCIYEVWNRKKNKELTEFEMFGFYKILGKQTNKLTESHLNSLLNSDKSSDLWVMKPFYYAHKGLDGVLRWQYIYDIYNKFIPNDGLIVKNRENHKYKIKPMEHMTIDLKIKEMNGYDEDNNNYRLDNESYKAEYENKIVQCLFNVTNNSWQIKKIRFDKKRPNPRNVIQKIEEIYREPYWLHSLSTHF